MFRGRSRWREIARYKTKVRPLFSIIRVVEKSVVANARSSTVAYTGHSIGRSFVGMRLCTAGSREVIAIEGARVSYEQGPLFLGQGFMQQGKPPVEVTLRQAWRGVLPTLPNEGAPSMPTWPPDVFGLCAYALRHASAYVRVLKNWPPCTDPDEWAKETRRVSQRRLGDL